MYVNGDKPKVISGLLSNWLNVATPVTAVPAVLPIEF
jgi:hypothetical protein